MPFMTGSPFRRSGGFGRDTNGVERETRDQLRPSVSTLEINVLTDVTASFPHIHKTECQETFADMRK